MRDTLLGKICAAQLEFEPHLVGRCPFAHEVVESGRKVFYYRAHATPDMGNVRLPDAGIVADFAWVERGDLNKYLSSRLLRTCRPALWV